MVTVFADYPGEGKPLRAAVAAGVFLSGGMERFGDVAVFSAAAVPRNYETFASSRGCRMRFRPEMRAGGKALPLLRGQRGLPPGQERIALSGPNY